MSKKGHLKVGGGVYTPFGVYVLGAIQKVRTRGKCLEGICPRGKCRGVHLCFPPVLHEVL